MNAPSDKSLQLPEKSLIQFSKTLSKAKNSDILFKKIAHVFTPIIPILRDRDRRISVNSRPTWSIEQVPEQAPQLHRETLSRNKQTKNKNKAKKEMIFQFCGHVAWFT